MKEIEIRIYYECLEQALHFVLPTCREALGVDAKLTLIEISKTSTSSIVAESLAAGLALRNPDGIVSVVLDGIEIPLVWVEFTTQVETEDHSLQGFNSLVAAGAAGIPFVKVVARRSSSADHGGNTSFDFREPYRLLWREYSTPSVQLDWPVTDDGSRALRHPIYRACPPSDLGLTEILSVCFEGVCRGQTASEALSAHALKASSAVATAIRGNMRAVAPYTGNSRSTRFYKRPDGRWELKFNRWSHSMDPERGMAEYFGTLLSQPLVGRMNDATASTCDQALHAMRRGTGITIPSSAVKNGRVDNAERFLSTSSLNRAGLIIAWYCDEFVLADASGAPLVELSWSFSKSEGLNVPFSIAPCTRVVTKSEVSEDDVTYVVANRILPQNDFSVLSVSYPGAQGDLAILTGSGRSVKRKYFDIIAVRSVDNSEDVVVLVEAKGKRQPSVIKPDVETVLAWSVEPDMRTNLLNRIEIQPTAIVGSSVAYPGTSPASLSRQEELDLVVLVDNEKWRVIPGRDSRVPNFDVLSGDSLLPIRHTY